MSKEMISQELNRYYSYLLREEKSNATCEKYLRDVGRFLQFSHGQVLSKELVLDWKHSLIKAQFAVRSINSMLASLNSYLVFLGKQECRVKNIRLQRQTYCAENRELTKEEYLRLLDAARGSEQLRLILQTICGTGIRVSELRYFTVDAARAGEVTIHCKNKIRTILIPGRLKRLLLDYSTQNHCTAGPIFTNRAGKPLDRSSIWRMMKSLCGKAGVKASKVFPHNLRKLFARTFYRIEKDIAKLADILGHSSINTTRIYIMTSGAEHRRQIEQLGLVLQEIKKPHNQHYVAEII